MKVKVKIEGLQEVQAALHELPKKATAKNILRRVGRKRLKPMAEEARRLAPSDQGDLKNSIAISSRQKSGRQVFRTREGKSTVVLYMGPTKDGYPQAIMQEFGTKHHRAQPFMRPAWDAKKHGLIERLAEELWSEIQAAVARAARKAARQKG